MITKDLSAGTTTLPAQKLKHFCALSIFQARSPESSVLRLAYLESKLHRNDTMHLAPFYLWELFLENRGAALWTGRWKDPGSSYWAFPPHTRGMPAAIKNLPYCPQSFLQDQKGLQRVFLMQPGLQPCPSKKQGSWLVSKNKKQRPQHRFPGQLEKKKGREGWKTPAYDNLLEPFSSSL